MLSCSSSLLSAQTFEAAPSSDEINHRGHREEQLRTRNLFLVPVFNPLWVTSVSSVVKIRFRLTPLALQNN